MSVNEIDVNAVNKRTREKCPDPLCSRDEPKHVEAIKRIREGEVVPLEDLTGQTAGTTPQYRFSSTWKGRGMYFVLDCFIFMESFIWTVMDLTRSARMKWAAKINNHNKK